MWDSAQIHVDENGMVGEGVKFERIRRITRLSCRHDRSLQQCQAGGGT